MTRAITLDPAREITLYLRQRRTGSKVFTFVDSTGAAVNVSAYEFELNIKEYAGSISNVISLTVGSGLTIGGAGSNQVTATVSVSNTNIKEGKYYWELYKGLTDRTYLCGECVIHNGKFDGVTETDTIIIDDAGSEVTVIFDGSSISNTDQLPEGSSNLYFTNARADARVSAANLVPQTRTVNGQALSANVVIPDVLYYRRDGQARGYSSNITAAATTTFAILANTIRAFPLIIGRTITFTQLLMDVTTPVASTTFRIAIYTDDGNGYPAALVANTDIQTYDSSTIGPRIGTAGSNIVLQPGAYWIAYNSNGAPTLRSLVPGALPPVMGFSSIGASANIVGWQAAQTYGSMPSTFPAGATAFGNQNVPLVILISL